MILKQPLSEIPLFQAAKWLKTPLLLAVQEMEELLTILPKWIVPLSGVIEEGQDHRKSHCVPRRMVRSAGGAGQARLDDVPRQHPWDNPSCSRMQDGGVDAGRTGAGGSSLPNKDKRAESCAAMSKLYQRSHRLRR